MPIEIPEMPEAVANALAQGLPKFAVAASAPSGRRKASPMVAKPSITKGARTIARSIEAALKPGAAVGMGVPVTVLGLDSLIAGQSLRQVKPRLWLQLLPAAEGGGRAMAEVDQRARKLTSVIEGNEVKTLAKRIDRLVAPPKRAAKSSRSAADAGDTQSLTLIRIPALHVTALWLGVANVKGGKADVVIPNDGPIAPLVPGQRYTLSEFQTIVATMAAERLAKTRDDMGG